MGQILVRNLDEALIKRLKQKAAREGLSVEETVRRILADAVTPDKKELLRELERIRAMSPPIVEPPFGWQLIREDRDRR
jgi:plasmid stability protein